MSSVPIWIRLKACKTHHEDIIDHSPVLENICLVCVAIDRVKVFQGGHFDMDGLWRTSEDLVVVLEERLQASALLLQELQGVLPEEPGRLAHRDAA